MAGSRSIPSSSAPNSGSGTADPASGPLTFRHLAALDVGVLKGVGERTRTLLVKAGVSSVLDVLTTYPRRLVDRTREARVRDLVPDEQALVIVRVDSVASRRIRGGRSMVTVRVSDETGSLEVSFFNQPFRARQFSEGQQVALFGRVGRYRSSLQMSNPVVDMIGDRTGRLVPIYPSGESLPVATWQFAGMVDNALERCRARGIADPVPPAALDHLGLPSRHDAMRAIHLPGSVEEHAAARRRLAFDELLRVQLVLVARKRAYERGARGLRHAVDGALVPAFVAALPFPLTGAQRRTIEEILGDLAAPAPMHRLLQGDVGSGKTVVAVAAMLTAVQGGHQAALMAPTEVLAEQHFAGVSRLLEGFVVPDGGNLFGDRQLRVELLTSRATAAQRRGILAALADGGIDLVIGTHALIQDEVGFRSLGVVVIDEQHRFGVEQRAALRDKAGGGATPDVLIMTATPIPRTAAMTVYGDLDVSVLDELPPGRTPIATFRSAGPHLSGPQWGVVRDAVEAGQQAYVVCPRIDDGPDDDTASVQKLELELSQGPLRGLRLAVLHGRLPAAEREEVMASFRRGAVDVLVATTVIEVGVDVPNATVMVVVDADRFGIAQLHQLRGRVGRGSVASQCWLHTEERGPSPRVEALVGSTDGFVLAEIDLELRGEGTLMGAAQKGESDLKLASLRRDRDLIEEARRTAFALVDDDPTLSRHPDLRDEISLVLSPEEAAYLFKS
jgi:ATP-dependent DNA helicase RecG